MKKAQSVLEYSLLASLFIMAFLAIQVYLARAIQGKFQESSDQVFDQYGRGTDPIKRPTQEAADKLDQAHTQNRVFEITIPGLGSPKTFIRTRGSFSQATQEGAISLEQTRP